MNRAAFASLCGVAKSMITKYGPYLVTNGSEVDAAASLAALEGRLDETKRQRALQVLRGGSAAETAPGGGPKPAAPLSAKAEKDAIERDLRMVELGQRTGALILASDVDAAAREAVALMRETLHTGKRELAARLCATFDVPPEKAGAVARMIGNEFERSLGRFAQAATALADSKEVAIQPEVDAHAVRMDAPEGQAPASLL